jgi:hypothetical protein
LRRSGRHLDCFVSQVVSAGRIVFQYRPEGGLPCVPNALDALLGAGVASEGGSSVDRSPLRLKRAQFKVTLALPSGILLVDAAVEEASEDGAQADEEDTAEPEGDEFKCQTVRA